MKDMKPMMHRRKSKSPMSMAESAFLLGATFGVVLGGTIGAWLTLIFIKASGG